MFLCGKKNNFNQSAKYVNSIWCKKKRQSEKLSLFLYFQLEVT